jgi:hypothetical protein
MRLLLTLFLLFSIACQSDKKQSAAQIAQAKKDSISKISNAKITFKKPQPLPNAVDIINEWRALNEYDQYLNSFFGKNKWEVMHNYDALVEATNTFFEGEIPEAAKDKKIISRMQVMRTFVMKLQDDLIDVDISDSVFNQDLKEIQTAYNGLYVQLNKINLFKPNPDLLDTIN